MTARTPSASTISRSNFCSADRSPTTSPTYCSIPWRRQLIAEKQLDWIAVLEEEPEAGLGNGGLGRLAACFLDSMATMQLPAMGYGLRYEYGMFRQSIENGWQQEKPDNWLRRPDPWEIARPQEQVSVNLNCSFEVARRVACEQFRGGRRPSSGFRTTARSSATAERPSTRFASGRRRRRTSSISMHSATANFVGAVAETLEAESLTRVLYPDDSTALGQGLRFVQEYFLVACSLADLVRRFRRRNSDWHALPGAGGDATQRHPSRHGRGRTDADSPRRSASRLG